MYGSIQLVRPDITVMVDWALKINNLSTIYPVCKLCVEQCNINSKVSVFKLCVEQCNINSKVPVCKLCVEQCNVEENINFDVSG